MPDPQEILLQSAVLDRLTRLRGRLGPRLAGALDRLAGRLLLGRGGGPGYFLHPLALPILQLPAWVAALPGGAFPPEAVIDAAEASAVGYLHVRVQDDLIDEGVSEGAATLLLSDALYTRHQRLLAGIAGDHEGFWAQYEEVWLGYAEAMLLERALHDREAPYDRAAFRQVLDRSRPLVLPAAAVLARKGRHTLAGLVEDYVEGLTAAHQLFTDLVDAEKDLASGNHTWVVQRYSAGPEEAPAASTLRRRLYLEGGFDEVMAEVEEALEGARRAARALGAPPACEAFLDRRQAVMERVRQQAFKALFVRLTGSSL